MARWMIGATAFAAGAGAGAAAEYLLDPQQGRRRRNMALEQLTARLRRGAREAEGTARHAAERAKGAAAAAAPGGRDASELNDEGLKAKVESELFRPADAPKGAVDVNVEAGVVFLRGEMPDRERIERLAARAGEIDGVLGVENLLHLAGEPAPMKR